MRRLMVLVIGSAMAALVLTPGIADAAVRHGVGSMTGPGGVTPRCDGIPTGTYEVSGSGSFVAKNIGIGGYNFHGCLTQLPAGGWDVVGTASFSMRSGATIGGTIDETIPAGSPTFTVTVTNGTKRYKRARGTLTMGPLTQSNFNTCDPATGDCYGWTDTGPFSGTLTHVPPRR